MVQVQLRKVDLLKKLEKLGALLIVMSLPGILRSFGFQSKGQTEYPGKISYSSKDLPIFLEY